jgi:hypothetical protein
VNRRAATRAHPAGPLRRIAVGRGRARARFSRDFRAPISRHEPDLAMQRAFFPISRTLVLLASLAALHHTAAAGPPAPGGRGQASTFTMLVTATPPQAGPRGAQNGVGIAPSKPVVRNPYNVPLLQNAGSVRSLR